MDDVKCMPTKVDKTANTVKINRKVTRCSHFQIPGGQKMARAALSKRAIDGRAASTSRGSVQCIFLVI